MVTDFGVSTTLQNSIAMCGTFVGTFKYMSPERIASAPYSYASDVWSSGLVLLECATGRYPYPVDDTCIGMAQTILEAPAPAPPPGASREFGDFIAGMLPKHPASRIPAEILLTAPWLCKHGATSVSAAIAGTRKWVNKASS